MISLLPYTVNEGPVIKDKGQLLDCVDAFNLAKDILHGLTIEIVLYTSEQLDCAAHCDASIGAMYGESTEIDPVPHKYLSDAPVIAEIFLSH
jgi:hypothetical protein